MQDSNFVPVHILHQINRKRNITEWLNPEFPLHIFIMRIKYIRLE